MGKNLDLTVCEMRLSGALLDYISRFADADRRPQEEASLPIGLVAEMCNALDTVSGGQSFAHC